MVLNSSGDCKSSQATEGPPVSQVIYWGLHGSLPLFYCCSSGCIRHLLIVTEWIDDPGRGENRRSDPCFVAAPLRVPSCIFRPLNLRAGREGQRGKLHTSLSFSTRSYLSQIPFLRSEWMPSAPRKKKAFLVNLLLLKSSFIYSLNEQLSAMAVKLMCQSSSK